MTARIARGSAAVNRRAPARGARPTAKRRGKARQPGLLDDLPISPRTLRRMGLWAFIVALLIIGAATAIAFRLPQRIGQAIGEQVGAAGFTVTRVELLGLNRLNPAVISKAALDQPSLAMPLLDLDAVRDRLMQFRWVKEARVSRRLPDTLVVEIVERVPAAVWQHNRQLQLVDNEGVPLEPVRADAMPDLPLVIGPGAQHRVAALAALLEAAPQLREHFAGATWIGGRRWDLRFKTGETVSLPEGEEPSLTALRRFAEMNARRRLLGGNFVRFDLRIEGKMIVQLRNAPEGRVPAVSPAPAPQQTQPPQDLSRTI